MIEKRKLKKGYSYRARVPLPNGKKLSKTFSRKSDAEKWERQITYQIQTGEINGEATSHRYTFNDLVRLWYVNKIKTTKTQRTIKNYKSDVRVHLLDWLGSTLIKDIKRSHADFLIRRMRGEKVLSERTTNKILTRLKQILNYAVEAELLDSNPLHRFPELKEPPKKDVYLTKKEIQQLLVANNQEWTYPILVLAVNTGMRIGELAGLCWDRINFETSQIEVTRTMSREGLQETTKSHHKRYMPMNSVVEQLLKSLWVQQKHPRFVLVNEKLSAIDVNHFSQRAYKKALKRAGVSNIRFHDLRHTFASQFMMNGGNIYDLQKLLGHSNLEMTMRYAHLSPNHLREASKVVEFSGNNTQGPVKVPATNVFSVS